MRIAGKMWIAALLIVLLAVAVVRTAGRRPRLRSAHAEPAVHMLAQPVVVTAEGKLYHHPDCKYIRGERRTMSAEEAARLGYTPCTRCMREALK